MTQQNELTVIPSVRRPHRRFALVAGVLALAATMTGVGLGARVVPTHAAEPPDQVTIAVGGPTLAHVGATVTYTWRVAATSPTGVVGVNLQVTGLRNPQFSQSGNATFSCQPGAGVSDFYRDCYANLGMEAGQTETFTVTGQAPHTVGTITADGSMSEGTQTVANISTTVVPFGVR